MHPILLLYILIFKNETTPRHQELSGYFGEIVKILAQSINFTIDRQEEEKYYGVFNSTTNSYSGIIGKLVKNETDLSATGITMTRERLKVVDYSIPIVLTFAKFYVKEPTAFSLHWSMYYKVSSFFQDLLIFCLLKTIEFFIRITIFF